MPRHVFLLLGFACGVCLITPCAQGQFTTVSQTQHGESNAALAWSSGFPPSTASNTQTLNGPGVLHVPAVANNFGITSVAAAAYAQTELQNLPDGYLLDAQGYVSGHSNLAAFASGSYSSYTSVEFAISRSVDATLSLTFLNAIIGTAGNGGGNSSVQLTEPGGATLFSYTHTPIGSPYFSTAMVALSPGTYTLRVDSHISMQFIAYGTNDNTQASVGIVQLTVPGPGGIALLGILVLAGGGKRRRSIHESNSRRTPE